MKRLLMVIFVLFVCPVFFFSCRDREKRGHEGRWRVIDEVVYEPKINFKNLMTSLDELEKLIYAPYSYFRDNGGMRMFVQNMNYTTQKQLEDEKRSLELKENVELLSDNDGNYVMSFANDRNEGYVFVWKNNFLYRKQMGGEFSRTFSMGEHRHYRETNFGSIPSIYSVLRNHAHIKGSSKKTLDGIEGTEVKIIFKENPSKRKKLPDKRYLQNLFGTEEMKDDSIVKEFAESKKENVRGELILFLDNEYNIINMTIDCGFDLVEEGVEFSVKGERMMTGDAVENIDVPEYEAEYHRRTLDAAVNIMNRGKRSENSEKQTEKEKDNDNK